MKPKIKIHEASYKKGREDEAKWWMESTANWAYLQRNYSEFGHPFDSLTKTKITPLKESQWEILFNHKKKEPKFRILICRTHEKFIEFEDKLTKEEATKFIVSFKAQLKSNKKWIESPSGLVLLRADTIIEVSAREVKQ